MEKISFLLSLLLVVSFGFVSGSPPKEAVGIYELKKGDMSVKFTNWGATIISVVLPDKHGLFLGLFGFHFSYLGGFSSSYVMHFCFCHFFLLIFRETG